jgi:phage shock protein PspC (stress-responsive transcriptional regulator)
MNSGSGTKVLVRKRNGRMVAGVCAGLADYFGSDVTLLRVIVAVVAVVTGGAGILAYLVAWAIIPEEDQQSPVAENQAARTREGSPR